MNRSLQDIGGGLLLVPQFTLAADTRKGMRPSRTPAADPGAGERVFAYLGERAQARHRSSILAASGLVCKSGSPMMGRSHSGCGQGPGVRPARRPSHGGGDDGRGAPCHGAIVLAAQRRGDLGNVGVLFGFEIRGVKAPRPESTEDLPHPSLRRPEKTNATPRPTLFTASPEIRLNFFLKRPKKLIATLPAAPTPLKRLRRLPSPPWVYKMDPSASIVSTVDCG